MRHRVAGRKLGRSTSHRQATLRNLTQSLFERDRIRTTLMKAKEMRPFAERLITLSKKGGLHRRRLVARQIPDRKVLRKLFDSISARYSDRPGGYLRILKLGPRKGDCAEMALVELVGLEPAETEEKDEGKKKKSAKGRKESAAKPKAAAKKASPAKKKKKTTKKKPSARKTKA
jgi:large subunit ribosomal protein L17